MVLTDTGLAKVFQRIKSFVASQLNSKASAIHTHTSSDITDLPNGYVPRSGGAVLNGKIYARNVDNESLMFIGGTTYNLGAYIELYGKDRSTYSGCAFIRTIDASNNVYQMALKPDGTLTWGSKNVAMQEDVVPRSGGAVMTGSILSRNVDNDGLIIRGGAGYGTGAQINLYGANRSSGKGAVYVQPNNSTDSKSMVFVPDGTWTWDGTAVQITSDQRYKQQIDAIDDKLLDAWEDVNLVQFKYNDAVNEKGTKARLHTGYVVQQIDEACQKHNINISEYGLYCHEEYPERTEEVTIENEDGTTSKETKVIEPAKEYYSLRYTETLVVECAYLRRENTRLKTRLLSLEERLEKLENSENSGK